MMTGGGGGGDGWRLGLVALLLRRLGPRQGAQIEAAAAGALQLQLHRPPGRDRRRPGHGIAAAGGLLPFLLDRRRRYQGAGRHHVDRLCRRRLRRRTRLLFLLRGAGVGRHDCQEKDQQREQATFHCDLPLMSAFSMGTMRMESMVAAVSNPPLGLSCSLRTTPRHSSAVCCRVEMTKEMVLPTANDTGEAKTTLSTPTLRVVPRTSPMAIGMATSWHGHDWPSTGCRFIA